MNNLKNYKLFRDDKLMHRGSIAIFCCKPSLCPIEIIYNNIISNIDVQYIGDNGVV